MVGRLHAPIVETERLILRVPVQADFDAGWGQGFATEAARACLAFVFDELGWARVGHMIHRDNMGSKAVAMRSVRP